MTRRALAIGVAAALGAGSATARPRSFFERRGLDIGLQLYVLADALKQDLEGTLSAVAAIGYRAVELPGFLDVDLRRMGEALRRARLRCPSAHANSPPEMAKAAEAAAAIGFDRVVTSLVEFPPRLKPEAGENIGHFLIRATPQMTPDDWKRSAEQLNKTGAGLKARGLKFSYHNHNHEFAPGPTGRPGYDILLQETDPELVSFEIDVGWVRAAGRDPLALLAEHRGRFALMHMKDLRASTKPNFAFQMQPADVGAGSLNWPQILTAGYAAGVRHYFVEREPPYETSRMESSRRSFAYLSTLRA